MSATFACTTQEWVIRTFESGQDCPKVREDRAWSLRRFARGEGDTRLAMLATQLADTLDRAS